MSGCQADLIMALIVPDDRIGLRLLPHAAHPTIQGVRMCGVHGHTKLSHATDTRTGKLGAGIRASDPSHASSLLHCDGP